ncbi:MAG TPA: hypothetical protein VG755_02660 [Nannocystaceae bacterium]|nr:hypothetical protein [Nannocystaceae bacterium]
MDVPWKPAAGAGRAQGRAHRFVLAIAILPGLVATPASARSAPAAEDPKSDVGAMWREANAKLATSDYAGAITLLTRVYEEIATDPDARMLRLRVRWALHEAHVGAERVDHDAQHLYVARELLKNGMSDFGPDDAELRSRSETALADLDQRIATIEAEQRDAAEQKRLAEEQAAAEERKRAAQQHEAAREPPPPRPTTREPEIPRRGMLIGGGVSAGVGVLGLAILAGGFGSASQAVHTFEVDPEARDAARRGIGRGNAIGIAGAVIAGVGIAVAAVLVPLAFRRSDRAAPRSAVLRRLPRWDGFADVCANASHPRVTAARSCR